MKRTREVERPDDAVSANINFLSTHLPPEITNLILWHVAGGFLEISSAASTVPARGLPESMRSALVSSGFKDVAKDFLKMLEPEVGTAGPIEFRGALPFFWTHYPEHRAKAIEEQSRGDPIAKIGIGMPLRALYLSKTYHEAGRLRRAGKVFRKAVLPIVHTLLRLRQVSRQCKIVVDALAPRAWQLFGRTFLRFGNLDLKYRSATQTLSEFQNKVIAPNRRKPQISANLACTALSAVFHRQFVKRKDYKMALKVKTLAVPRIHERLRKLELDVCQWTTNRTIDEFFAPQMQEAASPMKRITCIEYFEADIETLQVYRIFSSLEWSPQSESYAFKSSNPNLRLVKIRGYGDAVYPLKISLDDAAAEWRLHAGGIRSFEGKLKQIRETMDVRKV